VPTYQYRCTECDAFLEVKQSFDDAALTQCPECGGTLRKVFGSAGVVFKGSGFYRTDSRKADSAKSTSSKPASSATSSSSSD
jgi:putative FmdB family regulatory protein